MRWINGANQNPPNGPILHLNVKEGGSIFAFAAYWLSGDTFFNPYNAQYYSFPSGSWCWLLQDGGKSEMWEDVKYLEVQS